MRIMIQSCKVLLSKFPLVKGALHARRIMRHRFLKFPPGHFYSPLPGEDWREERIDPSKEVEPGRDGVDLNSEGQLQLLEKMGGYASDYPFAAKSGDGLRYGYANDYFPRTDGAMLYAMLRHWKPERVIEVGSGHSSALMLDVNERYLEGKVRLSFIEPYPARLLGLLSEREREVIDLHRCRVQEVDPKLFEGLKSGDILFIDSSHVSRFGSDVNHLLFNVLPRLAEGVIVHIHDIPYPFEYPDDWFDEGRAWNEAYAVRAFLQYNGGFEILLWSSYLGRHHAEAFSRAWPALVSGSGFSLWLRKR